MIIIPAVDILAGRCVRLVQGRREDETVYGNDPVAMAKRWEAHGIKRLHVVDLDGAFEQAVDQKQTSVNTSVIAAIARELSVPVQLGGGLRSKAAVAKVLEAGITYAIIGTIAVADPDETKAILQAFPDRVYVGIDAREGKVAIKGWKEITDRPALDLAEEVAACGARGIIYTDIARDGTLGGPNVEALRTMSERILIPVIASGGISSLEDLITLSRISNIEGVITGKALYDGRIDLPRALELEVSEGEKK